jgi:CBS domain-containing protein
MQVGDIMTRVIFTCDTQASLEDIARVMSDHDCGYVPIVNEHDKLKGVVTDRDVALAAYNQGKRLADIPVVDVMAQHVHTCAADASVELAHQIMRSAEIRRLPVVGQGGKLVGLVTWSDLFAAAHREPSAAAAAAAKEQIVETLEATSTSRR